MAKSVITALDVGTTKISAVIAEISEELQLKIKNLHRIFIGNVNIHGDVVQKIQLGAY